MTGVSGGAPLRVVTVCDVDSGAARRGLRATVRGDGSAVYWFEVKWRCLAWRDG